MRKNLSLADSKRRGHTESRWDRLGVWASFACAIHCLAAPLLFLAVPTFASVWAHPSSHALIALLVLPLAGTVLFKGFRIHGRVWVAAAAGLGAVCILVGSALPFLGGGVEAAEAAGTCAECCPQLVETEAGGFSLGWPPASIATMLGSFFLIASHLGNLTCCKRGSCSA